MLTGIACLPGVSLDAATRLMHTNPDVPPLAHLGTQTTTFFRHGSGHGRVDLTTIKNLDGCGWVANHAFAMRQQPWDAMSLLVAPTAFSTAMSHMQVANQLPMLSK